MPDDKPPQTGKAPSPSDVLDGLQVLAAILTVLGFVLATVVYVPQALREAELPGTLSIWLLWVVATAMAVIGGFVWFIPTKGLYFGGTTAEPRGRNALLWAVLTGLPVAVSFVWLAVVYLETSPVAAFVAAMVFLACYAIGARLFYGGGSQPARAGVRVWVEGGELSRMATETFVSAIWGIVLGIAGLLPSWLVALSVGRASNPLNALTAVALVVLAPTLAVFLVVSVTQPGTTGDSQRGIIAGVALRTALLFALVLTFLP